MDVSHSKGWTCALVCRCTLPSPPKNAFTRGIAFWRFYQRYVYMHTVLTQRFSNCYPHRSHEQRGLSELLCRNLAANPAAPPLMGVTRECNRPKHARDRVSGVH